MAAPTPLLIQREVDAQREPHTKTALMNTHVTLPNLVIAGLARSGTSAMFQYLIEHPDVCGSKKKEAFYFTNAADAMPLPPIDAYAELFDAYAGERVVVEATPTYFNGGRAVAEAIDRTLGPDAKILVSLREPVARLVSTYNLQLSRLRIQPDTTLAAYVDACRQSPTIGEARDDGMKDYQAYQAGFYGDILPHWFSVFGPRLQVVFFERLEADPAAFMVDIARWLGIDAAFYQHRGFEIQNPTMRYRLQRVHRLANAVNERAEPWLRRRPALKNALRRVYASVNSASASPSDEDTHVRERLRDDYADSNRRARTLLEQQGYTELPGWLTRDSG